MTLYKSIQISKVFFLFFLNTLLNNLIIRNSVTNTNGSTHLFYYLKTNTLITLLRVLFLSDLMANRPCSQIHYSRVNTTPEIADG